MTESEFLALSQRFGETVKKLRGLRDQKKAKQDEIDVLNGQIDALVIERDQIKAQINAGDVT